MTADAVSAGAPRAGTATFGVLQRLGRSLMLPIAALPVAALLLRLGQPDMQPGCRVGPTTPCRRCSRRRQRAVRQPAAAVRGRRRDRMARKADGSTALAGRRRLPRLQGRRRRDVAVVLGSPAEGDDQALINYGVLGGIVDGPDRRRAVAALPPDQAAALPRVLRRPALRADHHRVRGDRVSVAAVGSSTRRSTPGSPPSASGSPTTTSSAASSTASSTGC